MPWKTSVEEISHRWWPLTWACDHVTQYQLWINICFSVMAQVMLLWPSCSLANLWHSSFLLPILPSLASFRSSTSGMRTNTTETRTSFSESAMFNAHLDKQSQRLQKREYNQTFTRADLWTQLSPVESEIKWSSALQASVCLSASVIFTKCHQKLWALTITPPLETLPLQVPKLSDTIMKEKVWDSKVGFKIPYGPYTTYHFLTCNAVTSGRKASSVFIPTRQSESMSFLGGRVHIFKQTKKVELSYFFCFVCISFFLHLSSFYSSCSQECDDHPKSGQSIGWRHHRPQLHRRDHL